MNISSRRARQVAITALVFSIVSFVTCLVIGGVSFSPAVLALAWLALAGVFAWVILVIVFHQRTLAEQEKLDLAQLAKSKRGDTIFQAEAEGSELFAVAQKRLRILEKWFVPAFGILLAVYEILIGLSRIRGLRGGIELELRNQQLSAVFMAGVAFLSFLISRYATGMSVKVQWKPLRAGGSYMLATAILAFTIAVGLALAQFKIFVLISVLNWVIPVLLILLGAETALNAVFDIYRPRISGQYSRTAFDSRLLGVFNEPGGILHTFASAIDYQFGFKVSQTWFYKLLEEAILPLVLFGIVTLYLLSSIVVIKPGDEAIVERLGAFKRVLKPGPALKLPWPVDKVYVRPTTRIQQINVGFEVDEKSTERKPLLWGEPHYKHEDKLLLAAKWEGSAEDAVPVSLLVAAVPVHYHVSDLKAFEYNHVDSGKILKAICEHELAMYAAGATIEIDEKGGSDTSLLGAGREAAAQMLKERIQEKANSAGLGVEVVFLGLQGVHPPQNVARDYQDVVAAVQKKQAAIMEAQAVQNRVLVSLCGGDVAKVNQLYELAVKYQFAKETGSADAKELGRELDESIAAAKGEIFEKLSDARSYAFEKSLLAEATGRRFGEQIKAFRESPDIYMQQLRLGVLEEMLPSMRKYVILTEASDTQVIQIDLQEDLRNTLMDINVEEINKLK
jgi:regulator of protease activity HflC (stomatin/prohibitin superfamily)